MLKHLRRLATVLVASAAVAAPVALLATSSAQADTNGCATSVQTHNGVTGNFCGSQELVPLNLELAVPNKAVQYAQLTVKPTSSSNASEDFQFFNPAGVLDNAKVIEWTPQGVASNLCAAVSNNHRKLVLKTCNFQNAGQQFVANATGGPNYESSWDSELTGQAITAPGAAFSRLIMANDVGGVHQAFTFEQ